jgi:mRNA interferase HigB
LHYDSVLIVGLAGIEDVLRKNAAARSPMLRWVQIVQDVTWRNIVEARKTFPTADAVKGTNFTCFNIGGNSYRLLTVIHYDRQQLFVRELLTHAQYDKRFAG